MLGGETSNSESETNLVFGHVTQAMNDLSFYQTAISSIFDSILYHRMNFDEIKVQDIWYPTKNLANFIF